MKKLLRITLLLILAFCAGCLTTQVVEYNGGFQTANYASVPKVEMASTDGNWGLSFPVKGQTPVGDATADYLKQSNLYYRQNTQDKMIYLTFDTGYENGNAATILDALKKHNVPATSFLVGNYSRTDPDLIKHMVTENHTVGNHIFHHPGISKISTKESFEEELNGLETLFQQTAGQPMRRYYRPPRDKYSENSLGMVDDMGYRIFLWSLACVD